MSSQTVRVASGDTIQIKTGAIQGIGPAGPTGPTGPQGATGDTGPQGERGEMGYVDESVTYVRSSGAYQAVAPATPTLVETATTTVDDFNARQSLTTFKLPVGSYVFHAMVTFQKSAGTPSGHRIARMMMSNTMEWEMAVPANTDDTDTSVIVTGGLRVTNADAEIAVQAEHTDSLSLSLSAVRIWFSRIGAGQPGPQGETGPQGPVGATGPTGPTGPAGSLMDNTTSFDDISGA